MTERPLLRTGSRSPVGSRESPRPFASIIDYLLWYLMVAAFTAVLDQILTLIDPSLGYRTGVRANSFIGIFSHEVWMGTLSSPLPQHQTASFLYAFLLASVGSNLFLGLSASFGGSAGKAACRLRLLTFTDEGVTKPGLARGYVRSSIQAVPFFGIPLCLASLHDMFAGTEVVHAADAPERRPGEGSAPRIALWKIALATVVHVLALLMWFIFCVI